MAADAYLKAAAGQLQQAANAVKQTADQIRADSANARRQIEHDLLTMQTEHKVKQMEMDRTKDDAGRASALAAQVKQLSQQIDGKKQELSQLHSQTEQAIHGKESTSQKLASQANGLAQQAGDPNLR